jgi:hypothetical protein
VLPVGRYNIIGMDCIGTTLIAARVVFPFGGPRPGVLGRAALSTFPSNQFRNGLFGSFGEFTSYAQPSVDFFASSAASITFTGYFDMVKVA